MSKQRIRRVRTERDALLRELAETRSDLQRELDRRQEVKDIVGWHDPGVHDATQFRDELWEAITNE